MNITSVKIFPIETTNRLKAFASITIDDSFVVNDLRIIEGDKGFFVSMPSRKDKNGVFRDIAHPINAETRELLEKTVIEEYNKEINKEPETGDTEE